MTPPFSILFGVLPAVLPVALACGSDTGADGPVSAFDADAAPACQTNTASTELGIDWLDNGSGSLRLAQYRLGHIAATPDGPIVPISRQLADGSAELSLRSGDGALSILSTVPDSNAAGVGAAAIRLADGRDCVVYQANGINLSFACTDGTNEDAGDDVYGDALIPVEWANGTLSVFTRTFASFTEFRRTAAGSWSEIEKFESSISGPKDALAHDGVPAVCFVSSSDRAVIQFGAAEIASSVDVRRCAMVDGGDILHVATDQGYAAIPWSSLGTSELAPSGNALEETPLETLMIGEVPHAIVPSVDGLAIEALDVTSGSRRNVAAIPDGARERRAAHDPATGRLYVVTSVVSDTSNAPEPARQTIHIDTACPTEP